MLCSVWPWAYMWPLACVDCSDLRESGSSGRVEYAVAKPVPPTLLASSHPHGKVSFKILGARIILWPMDRPCRRCVLAEAAVDAWIVVCQEGSFGLKSTSDVALPLWAKAHAFTWEQGWPPCDANCETNSKIIRNYTKASVRINK
jgi:hypothetical protein